MINADPLGSVFCFALFENLDRLLQILQIRHARMKEKHEGDVEMIELIYNEEGEVTTEESGLLEPKNVKKIGEPKEYKKIFIEDYVHTFLLQQSVENETCIKAGVLFGKSERDGGHRHFYIKGALPVEQISEKQGKYCFTEKVWGDIYQKCEKYFPELEIMGWFLSKSGISLENTEVLEETHRTYFSGADKLLFVTEPSEQKTVFWGFDGNRFTRQPGYFIFYEKNELMREFLMEKNEQNSKENEKPDVAVANFRKILKEKQAKNVTRKKQVVTYGMKAAVALVFFVGAVALKNQTNKIKTMEQQMSTYAEDKILQETVSDEVIVEELPGNVEENQESIYDVPVVQEEPAEEEETVQEEPVKEEPVKDGESVQEEPVQEEPVQEELPVTEQMPEEEEAGEEEVQETAAEPPTYQQYVVMAGDTLAKISREKYGTDEMISQICALNEISDGDYIQEGEIILLP